MLSVYTRVGKPCQERFFLIHSTRRADEVGEGSHSLKIPRTFSRREALELGIKAAAATSVVPFLERYDFMYPQKAEAQTGSTNAAFEGGAGWFYTETRGDERDPQLGYKVEPPLWSVFQKYRGVNAWGFPETRPFSDEIGRLCQGFQKGMFQVTIDNQGRVQNVEWANLFDRLSELGEDDWLEQQFIPRAFRFDDAGKDIEQIEKSRTVLLDSYPQLKEAFLKSSREFQNPDLWKQQYGYPVAVKEYPDVVTVRTQRAALHQWKRDGPWGRTGVVTFANGMEMVKKKAALAVQLVPVESLLLELPDNAKAKRTQELERASCEKYGARRLPENIEGSSLFVGEMKRAFAQIKAKAPEFYDYIVDHVNYVFEDTTRVRATGAAVQYKGISVGRLEGPLSERDLLMLSSNLIHESVHNRLYTMGLQAGNRYGETAAVLKEMEFAKRARSLGLSNTQKTSLTASILPPDSGGGSKYCKQKLLLSVSNIFSDQKNEKNS